MSSSSLQPEELSSSHRTLQPCTLGGSYNSPSMSTTLRPAFTGPSDSSAFFPNRSPAQAGPSSSSLLPQYGNGAYRTAPPSSSSYASPNSHGQQQTTSRQVIDLTTSPSPPPTARISAQQAPQQIQLAQQQTSPPLPEELPAKTPVCIGQLTVTALVLYPISYLQPQYGPNSLEAEWAPVRMNYEHNSSKPDNSETIHIRTPNMTRPDGSVAPGENFGVVEQKVANYLGPMLGKGLIRLDGKVRRGPPNVSSGFK